MTISEAAKLSDLIHRTSLPGQCATFDPFLDDGHYMFTREDLTADDWEPVYEKVEVPHGSFAWAKYQMVARGMEVALLGQGEWMTFSRLLRIGAYEFTAEDMGARWECRKPADDSGSE